MSCGRRGQCAGPCGPGPPRIWSRWCPWMCHLGAAPGHSGPSIAPDFRPALTPAVRAGPVNGWCFFLPWFVARMAEGEAAGASPDASPRRCPTGDGSRRSQLRAGCTAGSLCGRHGAGALCCPAADTRFSTCRNTEAGRVGTCERFCSVDAPSLLILSVDLSNRSIGPVQAALRPEHVLGARTPLFRSDRSPHHSVLRRR